MQVPESRHARVSSRLPAALLGVVLLLLVLLPPSLPTLSLRRSAYLVTCLVFAAMVLRTAWMAWSLGRSTRLGWWFVLLGMVALSLHDLAGFGSKAMHFGFDTAVVLQILGYVALGMAGLVWGRVRTSRTLLQGIDAAIIAVASGIALWAIALFNSRGHLSGQAVWLSALLTTFVGFAVASFSALALSDDMRRRKAAAILLAVVVLAASDIQGLVAALHGRYWFGARYDYGMLLGYALIVFAAVMVAAQMDAQSEPVPIVRFRRSESWTEFAFVVLAMAVPPLAGFTLEIMRRAGVPEPVHAAGYLVAETAGAVLLGLVAARMLLVRRSSITTLDRLLHVWQGTEGAQDGIVMLDERNLVTQVNPGFSVLYGWAADDIVGRDLRLLDGGDQPEAFWETVYDAVGAFGTWTGQIQNRDQGGQAIPIRLTFSEVRGDGEQVVGYTQVHHDLRPELERARVEARLDQEHEAHTLAQSIAALGLPLQETLDAASQALTALSGITSAFVCALRESDYEVLAIAGPLADVVQPGHPLPTHIGDAVAASIHMHAVLMPWTRNTGEAGPDLWQRFSESSHESEPAVIAFAPIRTGNAVVAAIAVCDRHGDHLSDLTSVLPAIDAFASTLGVRVGPAIELRLARKQQVHAITTLINQHDFHTVFQPICDLATGAPVGYEALTRFPSMAPDAVFAQAAALGVGLDLEIATLDAALELAQTLPTGHYLSVNASPDLITSRFLHTRLAVVQREIVVELTEHDAITHYGDMRRLLDALRPFARIAVDDTGSGYSSLQHLVEFAPDVIKVDIALVRDIDRDPAKQAMVNAVTSFAQRIGATVIAEGIETEPQREALRALGLQYGQGFLLGRPEPIPA